MSTLDDSLSALREPEFRKLFIGQAASIVGTMFRVVALPFAVLAIGGTATDIGIVIAAGLRPARPARRSSAACGPTGCRGAGSCWRPTPCARSFS